MFCTFISNIEQLQKEICQDARNPKPYKGYLLLISEWLNAAPESQNHRNIFWKGLLAFI